MLREGLSMQLLRVGSLAPRPPMQVCFVLFLSLLLGSLHSGDGTPAAEGRFECCLAGLIEHSRVLRSDGRLADDETAAEGLL